MPGKPLTIGGQAVIEGVMMRSPQGYAIAVRKADGSVRVRSTAYQPWSQRHSFLKLPILRGAVSLVEMMIIGFKALDYSANEAIEDEEKAKKTEEPPAAPPKANSQDKGQRAALLASMAFGLLLGIGLFVVVPNLIALLVGKISGLSGGKPWREENSPVLYNLVSGMIRMLLVVCYIWGVSLMKDIRRLFQYHGAEHKAVSAFEAGHELTVENVRPYSTLHPRCGSTFIAIVLLVAIVVFAFFARVLMYAWPEFAHLNLVASKAILIFGHVLIMPVVAGVCFELLRFGGKHSNNPLVRIFLTPGFWFQRLTTKQPDDSMLEIAIASLKAALALPACSQAPCEARAAEEDKAAVS